MGYKLNTRMCFLELTSEEVTARRRSERRQFKLDRARAIAAVAEEAENIFAAEGRVVHPTLSGPSIPSGATWRPSQTSETTNAQANQPDVVPESASLLEEGEEEEPLVDVEHLQLTLQEAFFLLWSIDCLTILDPERVRLAHYTYLRTYLH